MPTPEVSTKSTSGDYVDTPEGQLTPDEVVELCNKLIVGTKEVCPPLSDLVSILAYLVTKQQVELLYEVYDTVDDYFILRTAHILRDKWQTAQCPTSCKDCDQGCEGMPQNGD